MDAAGAAGRRALRPAAAPAPRAGRDSLIRPPNCARAPSIILCSVVNNEAVNASKFYEVVKNISESNSRWHQFVIRSSGVEMVCNVPNLRCNVDENSEVSKNIFQEMWRAPHENCEMRCFQSMSEKFLPMELFCDVGGAHLRKRKRHSQSSRTCRSGDVLDALRSRWTRPSGVFLMARCSERRKSDGLAVSHFSSLSCLLAFICSGVKSLKRWSRQQGRVFRTNWLHLEPQNAAVCENNLQGANPTAQLQESASIMRPRHGSQWRFSLQVSTPSSFKPGWSALVAVRKMVKRTRPSSQNHSHAILGEEAFFAA